MNQKPGVSPSVLRTVIIILFIEATIVWGFLIFRGLAQAVREAALRYEQNGNYANRENPITSPGN